MAITSSLKSVIFKIAPFKQWFNRWLSKRIPRKSEHTLEHRSIFIFPSKAGSGFVVLILLLWLLGTNYQNNLVLGMAFLLLSLIVICIHHTYANLSGLRFRVVKTEPSFVGEMGRVQLQVSTDNRRAYDQILCQWMDADVAVISLINDRHTRFHLSVPLAHRGWYQPPRLKVSTYYPLGLIVGWSYLALDAPILAWPKPISSSAQPESQILDDTDRQPLATQAVGNEEFAGVKEYQPGDSLRTIDWRALARGQGLVSKHYEDFVSEQVWLDWQQFIGFEREARLSRLCDAVLRAAEQSVDFGLRLPGLIIEPGQGELHQQRVLEALALFEWQEMDETYREGKL